MNGFHVITGTPRSGSTLLCNILNQNPAFHAGSTSPLPELMGVLVNKFSNSPEIQSSLIADRESTEYALNAMLLSLITCWYEGIDKTVFDKSRGWAFNATLLESLFPHVKIIATVRDLRNVFASVEKQHRKTPMFDKAESPNEKTIFNRADMMMAPDGLIGQCAVGMEDVMERHSDSVFVLQYEAFSIDPNTKIRELYDFLDVEQFDHGFSDIEDVSKEVDGLYHNKFPHQGSGAVTATKRQEWREYLSDELGNLIGGRYPRYNERFGY